MRKSQVENRSGHAPAAMRQSERKPVSSPGFLQGNTQQAFRQGPSSSVSVTLNNNTPSLAQRKRVESLQHSPVQLIQREKIQAMQLKTRNGVLQEKADVAQRAAEDEELMQGKFGIAQRVEEEELQAKFDTTQRVEEEELQAKFETSQRVEEDELIQGKFGTAQLQEETASPNQTGLPDNLKSGIESLAGVSMDAVRVHYNSDKPAQLNALAYAQGTNIHVASGQEKHLPHEAWHVVQQAEGRVKPTTEVGGAQVNDDKSLENEADTMGAKAMQFKPAKARRAGK